MGCEMVCRFCPVFGRESEIVGMELSHERGEPLPDTLERAPFVFVLDPVYGGLLFVVVFCVMMAVFWMLGRGPSSRGTRLRSGRHAHDGSVRGSSKGR